MGGRGSRRANQIPNPKSKIPNPKSKIQNLKSCPPAPSAQPPTMSPLRLTIWNEYIHEREHDSVRAIYPNGIHAVLADALTRLLGDRVQIRTATFDDPEHGLSAAALSE